MENQNNLDKIFNNQSTPAEYSNKYTKYLSQVLENLDYNSIDIGNDKVYEDIFSKQLEILLQSEAVFVSISAFENSPNLVKAVEYANLKNKSKVDLVCFNGGKLKEICKYVTHVKTSLREYDPVKDVHMILDDLMGAYFYIAIRVQK